MPALLSFGGFEHKTMSCKRDEHKGERKMNTTLTSDDILSIPVLEPERLFGTPDAVHDVYRALARRWHPDVPGGSSDVFAHIGSLLERAKHLVDAGIWHTPGLYEFAANGKQYRVRYLRVYDFELGRVLLGKTRITYLIGKDFADLAASARKVIEGLKMPSHPDADQSMRRYLPKIAAYHDIGSDVILSIEKPADLIRLRDLLDHLGGKIEAKHVAWIMSRMLNHASYLEWAKLSHNDLSLDSLFVCPKDHIVCLLGGWWYATSVGTSLKGALLPARTITYGPSELISKKLASARTDGELARLTARELLGDASGTRLALDRDLPKPMVDWLRMSGTSAITDYAQWREKILPASFGPRKFVRMDVDAKDVYAELKP
jgi:hypothetical protein